MLQCINEFKDLLQIDDGSTLGFTALNNTNEQETHMYSTSKLLSGSYDVYQHRLRFSQHERKIPLLKP